MLMFQRNKINDTDEEVFKTFGSWSTAGHARQQLTTFILNLASIRRKVRQSFSGRCFQLVVQLYCYARSAVCVRSVAAIMLSSVVDTLATSAMTTVNRTTTSH